MKKLFSLIILCTLAVSLVGCGSNNSVAVNTAQNTETTQAITQAPTLSVKYIDEQINIIKVYISQETCKRIADRLNGVTYKKGDSIDINEFNFSEKEYNGKILFASMLGEAIASDIKTDVYVLNAKTETLLKVSYNDNFLYISYANPSIKETSLQTTTIKEQQDHYYLRYTFMGSNTLGVFDTNKFMLTEKVKNVLDGYIIKKGDIFDFTLLPQKSKDDNGNRLYGAWEFEQEMGNVLSINKASSSEAGVVIDQSPARNGTKVKIFYSADKTYAIVLGAALYKSNLALTEMDRPYSSYRKFESGGSDSGTAGFVRAYYEELSYEDYLYYKDELSFGVFEVSKNGSLRIEWKK